MTTIREYYFESLKDNHYGMQLLIEFLVNEKKVLHMTDSTKELDRYFLLKHRERMNQLLSEYEGRMRHE